MYGHYFAKNSQIDDGMMKFHNAVMSERRVEKTLKHASQACFFDAL